MNARKYYERLYFMFIPKFVVLVSIAIMGVGRGGGVVVNKLEYPDRP